MPENTADIISRLLERRHSGEALERALETHLERAAERLVQQALAGEESAFSRAVGRMLAASVAQVGASLRRGQGEGIRPVFSTRGAAAGGDVYAVLGDILGGLIRSEAGDVLGTGKRTTVATRESDRSTDTRHRFRTSRTQAEADLARMARRGGRGL